MMFWFAFVAPSPEEYLSMHEYIGTRHMLAFKLTLLFILSSYLTTETTSI